MLLFLTHFVERGTVAESPITKSPTRTLVSSLKNFIAIFVLGFLAIASSFGQAPYKVLIFSETLGFRHDSITNGIATIQALGTTNNFTADATEDANQFTDANLAQDRAIIFLNTTGEVLDTNQQGAFQRYIMSGSENRNGSILILTANLTNSTNLQSGSIWIPMTNPPLLQNGQHLITLPKSNSDLFFRLQQ